MKKPKWSKEDRQRFADRNILKAITHLNKKRKASKEACKQDKWEDYEN
jgi:hypothetical protein